jgi:cyclopropane-fatty-acyl-phospholipid synthase
VFADAAPLHLSHGSWRRSSVPASATEHVYGFTADYAETLTHWLTRLEDHLEEAVRLAGEQRVRVWGIYLRAARSGFQTGFTSVYQVRAHLA